MVEREFRDLISAGMQVVSADGEKLGKVTKVAEESFEIEKGRIFRESCWARFEDVLDVRAKDIFLSMTKAQLSERGAAVSKPYEAVQQASATPSSTHAEGEMRIPLAEEEVVAHKQTREAGEVRVHKEVVTEEKQVTVPVQREVVRVEQVPATGARPANETAFQEETVTVPLKREEVELEKRPVVREEVRIAKDTREAEETHTTTARRERVDIESSGDIQKKDIPPAEPLRKAG